VTTLHATTTTCTGTNAADQWPLAQRAAQLVVVPALDGEIAPLGATISSGVGGVLLLGNTTPPDLAAQITAANATATTPLFVMADEEGGGVQRLAGHVPSLPWPREMAATMAPAQVQAAGERVGRAMVALGVNVDLAPVLDVDGGVGPNAHNPDGRRSFSADPAVVSTYGAAFMTGLVQAGVTPVVKHFPGLGGATANTDYGPADTKPLSALQVNGLPPFRAAIAAGAPAVMMSNAIVPGLTPRPAAVSAAATQGLLRGQLGFHGLVITDGLSANAISDAGFTVADAAVAAIEAGADMVLFGSTLTPAQTALLAPENVASTTGQIIGAIVTAAQSGKLSADRLDQAVMDVLKAKRVAPC
jgi:beta-N-acetylhexosaminidase